MFILESLYVSSCLHSSFFSSHSHENDSLFHPSRIETNNTHYHNGKHRDQLVFGTTATFIFTSTRKSDFSLEISMLAVWSSDCWLGPYLCMLFEFLCYLNEWLNTYIFCWVLNLNAILFGHDLSTKLFFFCNLIFFHIKNTKHKIFRDGNDRFICDIDSYGKSVVQNSHLVSHKQTHTINIQDMVVGFPSQGHKQTKTKTCALSLSVSDFLFWSNKKNCIQTVCWWSYHGIRKQQYWVLCSVTPPSQYFFSCFHQHSTKLLLDWTITQFFWLSERSKNKKENRFAKKKKPKKNKKTKQKCLSFSSALSLLFCVFGLAWIRLYITPKTKQKRSQITKKQKHKSVNPKQATRKTITQNQHGTQSWQNNLLLNSM